MTITWAVELDADPDTTGEFVIDLSLLGGADVLSADERWVDAGPVVMGVSIRRGRTDESGPYDTGRCTVELENVTEDFDTDNASSHYTMGPVKLLHPGTGVRVIGTANTAATVFTGYLDEPKVLEDQYFPTAVFECVDLMATLGTTDIPFQSSARGTSETSNARANWLLDQAAIPTARRAVDTSGRALLGTTGGGKVRAQLDRVANGEGGRFYVNRAGVVTLTWHLAEYGKSADLVFTNIGTAFTSYADLDTSPGIDGVINTATVHRVAPQVRDEVSGQYVEGPQLPDVGATDWDSVDVHGVRPVTVEVFLESDADAQELADYLAVRRSVPTARVTKLVLPPLEELAAGHAQFILELDIGSAIIVQRTTVSGRLQSWFMIVEGIHMDVRPSRSVVTLWTAPLNTAQVFGSPGWFTINVSLLGGVDVLASF